MIDGAPLIQSVCSQAVVGFQKVGKDAASNL